MSLVTATTTSIYPSLLRSPQSAWLYLLWFTPKGPAGNIYLRDFDSDGDLDIFHSTRDYTEINGAHIAINNGNGVFTSLNDSYLPKRPVKDSFSNNKSIAKGLPINLDNEGCLDLISAADVWGDSNKTVNYLYSLININCNFSD